MALREGILSFLEGERVIDVVQPRETIEQFIAETGLGIRWKDARNAYGLVACVNYYLYAKNLYHSSARELLALVLKPMIYDLSDLKWIKHDEELRTLAVAIGCRPPLAAGNGITAETEISRLEWDIGHWIFFNVVEERDEKLQRKSAPVVVEKVKRWAAPWRCRDMGANENNVKAFEALVKLGRIDRAYDLIKF